MSQETIFLLNTVSSFFMMGLIWYVQLVHYPTFKFIDEEIFQSFHAHHSLKTGIIVMPIMSIELASSGALTWFYGWTSLHAIGFYVVIFIWLSTFILSVPKHNALSHGKVDSLITDLIATNWVRTALWTAKSGISFYLLIS